VEEEEEETEDEAEEQMEADDEEESESDSEEEVTLPSAGQKRKAEAPAAAPAAKAPRVTSKTVSVSGMSPEDANSEDISSFFASCGKVTQIRLTLSNAGGNFTVSNAEVDFESNESAAKALDLSGKKLGEESNVVITSKASSAPAFAHNNGGGFQQERQPREFADGFEVTIGYLPQDATEDSIGEFFGECGNITKVRLIRDRDTGESKGRAFVSFDSEAGRDAALSKNQADFGGKNISVEIPRPRDNAGGGGRGGFGGRGGGRGGRGGFDGGRGGRGGFGGRGRGGFGDRGGRGGRGRGGFQGNRTSFE
jgi:nucleolin